MQEMARMQANMQAIKSAGRRSEEARRMHQQHEEELSRARLGLVSSAVHFLHVTVNLSQIKDQIAY